jgi:hypothetical protein
MQSIKNEKLRIKNENQAIVISVSDCESFGIKIIWQMSSVAYTFAAILVSRRETGLKGKPVKSRCYPRSCKTLLAKGKVLILSPLLI